ncbi:hypothetical protein J1614_012251 [Plenodomus biglobosus]|nr:hypothetical protein J1614_012251 [Plenodomus biglobosus]
MAITFSFKLDPGSLAKLTARGNSYAEWAQSWQYALRSSRLWNAISGKKTRPADETPDGADNEDVVEAWKNDDNNAMVMLP